MRLSIRYGNQLCTRQGAVAWRDNQHRVADEHLWSIEYLFEYVSVSILSPLVVTPKLISDSAKNSSDQEMGRPTSCSMA